MIQTTRPHVHLSKLYPNVTVSKKPPLSIDLSPSSIGRKPPKRPAGVFGVAAAKPRRWSHIGVISAACVAAPVGLSACGGAKNNPVAQAAVVKAAKATEQAKGLRVRFSMRVNANGLPGPITMTGDGSSDASRNTGTFNLAMHVTNLLQEVQTVRIQTIQDGDAIFVRIRPRSVAQSEGLGGVKQWAKTNPAGVASLTGSSVASNPASLASYLAAASDVSKVGSESVDGVRTTEYRAQIQLKRVPAAVKPASRPQVRKFVSSFAKVGIHVLPVSVWVDGQHRVRRMSFNTKGSASGQSFSMALRFDVPKYGHQPAPHLPPASQVADLKGM